MNDKLLWNDWHPVAAEEYGYVVADPQAEAVGL